MANPAVYVASPLGFSESGRLYGSQVLVPELVAAGFSVLDPWEDHDGKVASVMTMPPSEPHRLDALRAMNEAIGARNVELIVKSTLVLAILDGPDIDSGTAAEVGFAAALGRPVIGLRSDIRLIGDNEAAVVNLQVAYFIERSGGKIVRELKDAIQALGTIANKF